MSPICGLLGAFWTILVVTSFLGNQIFDYLHILDTEAHTTHADDPTHTSAIFSQFLTVAKIFKHISAVSFIIQFIYSRLFKKSPHTPIKPLGPTIEDQTRSATLYKSLWHSSNNTTHKLEQQIAELKHNISHVQNENNRLAALHMEDTLTVMLLQYSIREAEHDLAVERQNRPDDSTTDKQIKDLKKDLGLREREIDDLKQSSERACSIIQRHQQKLRLSNREAAQPSRQHKVERKKLNARVTNLRSEHNKIHTDLHNRIDLQANDIRELTEDSNTKAAQIATLKSEAELHERRIEELCQSAEEADITKGTYAEELDEVTKTNQSLENKVSELTSELSVCKEHIALIEELNLPNVLDNMNDDQKRILSLRNTISTMAQKHAQQLDAAHKKYHTTTETQEGLIGSLEQDLAQERGRNALLESQLAHSNNTNGVQLTNHNDAIQQYESRIEQIVGEGRAIIMDLNYKLDASNSQATGWKHCAEMLDEENTRLKQGSAEQYGILQAHQERIRDLGAANEQQNSQLEHQRREIDELKLSQLDDSMECDECENVEGFLDEDQGMSDAGPIALLPAPSASQQTPTPSSMVVADPLDTEMDHEPTPPTPATPIQHPAFPQTPVARSKLPEISSWRRSFAAPVPVVPAAWNASVGPLTGNAFAAAPGASHTPVVVPGGPSLAFPLLTAPRAPNGARRDIAPLPSGMRVFGAGNSQESVHAAGAGHPGTASAPPVRGPVRALAKSSCPPPSGARVAVSFSGPVVRE